MNSPEDQWKELYGDFQLNKDYSEYTIHNLPKESGWIRGEIVKNLLDIKSDVRSVLLPGEPLKLKKIYAELLDVEIDKIKTTGLYEDVDYHWNFEEDPPDFGKYDLIPSQAMIEHLVDPFKHVKDLSNSLTGRGYLLIHTVIPGFPYHRYPIDCIRFFPDWFESVGERLKLNIINKYVGDQRILYLYQNTNEDQDSPGANGIIKSLLKLWKK